MLPSSPARCWWANSLEVNLMVPRLRVFVPPVVLALASIMASSPAGAQGQSPLLGKPAPDVQLPILGGGGNGSISQLKGKVVVLSFFASW